MKVKRCLLLVLCCILLCGCSLQDSDDKSTESTTTTEEKSKHYDKAMKDAQEYHDAVVDRDEVDAYIKTVKEEKGWFGYLRWSWSKEGRAAINSRHDSNVKQAWKSQDSFFSMFKLKKTGTEEEIQEVQDIKDSIEQDSAIAKEKGKNDAKRDITVDKIKKWTIIVAIVLGVFLILFFIGYLRSGAYFMRRQNYVVYAPPQPSPPSVSGPVVMNSTQYIRTPEYRAVESYCMKNGIDVTSFIREAGGVHEAFLQTW